MEFNIHKKHSIDVPTSYFYDHVWISLKCIYLKCLKCYLPLPRHNHFDNHNKLSVTTFLAYMAYVTCLHWHWNNFFFKLRLVFPFRSLVRRKDDQLWASAGYKEDSVFSLATLQLSSHLGKPIALCWQTLWKFAILMLKSFRLFSM